jgi:hypothetical protein
MVALKKGDITQTPVQTQFGWHVIKLEDVRPAKVPTLEEVKPQIAEALQQKKLQAYQEQLRARPRCNKPFALIVEEDGRAPSFIVPPACPARSPRRACCFSYDRAHNFCTGDQKVARKPRFPPKNR